MPDEQVTAEEYSEGPARIQAADADDRLAAQIRERREAAGMSQDGLAKAMSAGGVSWYAQTVHRIESGHRKVSIGEAMVLAEIFETTADRLTWPGASASAAGLLEMFTARADQAWQQIAAWAEGLEHAQRQLRTTLASVEKDGYFGLNEIRELAEDARRAIGLTAESAVADASRDDIEEEPDDERG